MNARNPEGEGYYQTVPASDHYNESQNQEFPNDGPNQLTTIKITIQKETEKYDYNSDGSRRFED